MRNPAWSRDELILALDLYFRQPSARGSKTHPDVIALSETLNKLPIHPGVAHGATFRNPNGVGMKLSNFLAFDPDYKGKGLARGNRLEEEIWTEFASDNTKLRQIAQAILENYPSLGDFTPDINAEFPDDEEASEGRVLTLVHRSRERNSKIVRRKKEQILKSTGRLACEACGFDFFDFYGDIGFGYAECHHTKPVSELKHNEKTKLSDLRVVCANCHRMIHRAKPWRTVAEIASVLSHRGIQ